MAHSESLECVDHRVHDRRSGTDGPRFAGPFGPQRIHVGGRFGPVSLEAGALVRFGNCIVHQFAGHQLACLVVDGFFVERLSDGLGDPTVDLTIHQHRVDDPPAIVDSNVAEDANVPSLAIHFYRADVGPKWIGEVLWLERCSGTQARLESLRDRRRSVGCYCDLGEGDGFIAATEKTVSKRHIARGNTQQVSGETLHLVQRSLHRAHQRRASHRCVAAAKRADSILHLRCVAVFDRNIFELDPEEIRSELRERGLFALSVRRDAGQDGHLPRGFHTYRGALPPSRAKACRWPESAFLHVARNADSDELTLLAPSALLLTKLLNACDLKRAIERPLVITAVVGKP